MFNQIFGQISPPPALSEGYGGLTGAGGGLVGFLNNILKLAILVAGLYALINFIFAGYEIMAAGAEPEKLTKASNKIWYAILGLVIIVASFTIASLVGWIVFHDSNAILQLKIFGPGT